MLTLDELHLYKNICKLYETNMRMIHKWGHLWYPCKERNHELCNSKFQISFL